MGSEKEAFDYMVFPVDQALLVFPRSKRRAGKVTLCQSLITSQRIGTSQSISFVLQLFYQIPVLENVTLKVFINISQLSLV